MSFYLERTFKMRGTTEHVSVFYNQIQEFGWGPLVEAPLLKLNDECS